MKTILSFHCEAHRVQLVKCDLNQSIEKYVIYDNRKVISSFSNEFEARQHFYNYVAFFILQIEIHFPN